MEPPAGDSGTEAVGFRSLASRCPKGRGSPKIHGVRYVGLDSLVLDFRGGPAFVDTPGRVKLVKQGLIPSGELT